MQKQKSFALVALTAVLAALIAFGGSAAQASNSQLATAAAGATMAAGTMAAVTAVPGSGLVKAPEAAEAKSLTGIGATFPFALYTAWFAQYKTVTGVEVNYPDKQGSGKGIAAINDKTADFGATDAFITEGDGAVYAKVQSGDILHIPMTLGGVVLIYNLPDFKDVLKLTPDTLAAIYQGKITAWNDAALVADNPGLAKLTEKITTVHRSDSSGTTNVFTSYLSKVNTAWATSPGDSKDPGSKWPVQGLADSGNSGVAGKVKATRGAIGYVELTYAIGSKLSFSQLKNKSGNFITPSTDSVSAAAAALTNLPNDLRFSILNADAANAYSISAPTWQLVYKTQTDPAKALALTRLLWWELHDGQAYAAGLGYAPLPYSVIQKAEQEILSITVNGAPALPASVATPGAMMASTMSATSAMMSGTMSAATMAATK